MTAPRRFDSPLTVLCAASAVLFGGLTGRAMLDRSNDPAPAVLAALRAARGPAVPPVRAPRRVVLAVLDGLGGAPLEQRVEAGALGPVAWRARLDVGSPSLSRPVYHTLFTGVPQVLSGLRNNAAPGGARAQCVMEQVRAGGAAVAWALQSVRWMFDLCGAPRDEVLRGGQVTAESVAELFRRGPALLVVHLAETDGAGHEHGAASPQYAAAADRELLLLSRARALLASDPEASSALWLVGADHGHLPRGGHGGPEAAVREVTFYALGDEHTERAMRLDERGSVTSVASTVARALGVPPPRDSLASSLPFPVGEEPPAAQREAASARARAVTSAYLSTQAERGRARGLALLGLVLSVLALLQGRRRRGDGRAWSGALVVSLVSVASFAALGPGLTLSAIRTHEYFLRQSLLTMGLGAFLATPWAQRRGARAPHLVALSALGPLASWTATLGSPGRSLVGDLELLLWPALGLLPAGVLLGVTLRGALDAALSRFLRRRAPTQSPPEGTAA